MIASRRTSDGLSATPDHLHAVVTKAAMQSGKHVTSRNR